MNYYESPKQLYQGLLTGSSALLYTSPALATGGNALRPPSVILTEVLIANVDASDRALTLYIVPAAGSAGDSNTVIPAAKVKAGSFIRFTFATVLPAGAMIYAFAAAANKICLTISGVQRTPVQP